VNIALLHAHTDHSYRDSLIRVDELPTLAKAAGFSACSITDHGSISGIPRFIASCRKTGIKPILGCELYVTTAYDGDKIFHLTVLCRDLKGFAALSSILGSGVIEKKRLKRLTVPLAKVLEAAGSGLVVLSGCYSSPFWKSEKAIDDLEPFVKAYGDDFYFEVMPVDDWDEQIKLNRIVVQLADHFNRPISASVDCHFACATDKPFHDALLAVADLKAIDDPKAWKFSTKMSYLMTPGEIYEHLQKAGLTEDEAVRAIATTAEIADRCEITDLPHDRLPIAKVCDDPNTVLIERVDAALSKLNVPDKPKYYDRAEYELKTLIEAGLAEYLLLVQKVVDEFKKRGALVGPRGSVGGCLVAHLLGISILDPIRHDLIFERFYAPGRVGSLPDVDLDLPVAVRRRVPEILSEVFGAERVAQIATYSKYGVRQAARDAARTYGVLKDLEKNVKLHDPDEETDWAEDERKTLDGHPVVAELRKLSTLAAEFANRLVGKVRQTGAHAGGFVISSSPINGLGRGYMVNGLLCWDLQDADDIGHLKIDLLGNSTLDILAPFESALAMIPLDDAAVYTDFSEGRTAGTPQFSTSGMKAFLMMLKPAKFEDTVFANAAFRPGGLGQTDPAGLANRYHEDPAGLIVFQEDVMMLCTRVAGFSWTEADGVRKSIAKKLTGAQSFAAWKSKFVEGCLRQKTLTAEEGAALWDQLEGMGRYSFNKSHATAYSLLAYQIGWLKRHRTLDLYASALNVAEDKENKKGDEMKRQLLDEMEEMGVEVLPFSFNHSDIFWTPQNGGVRRALLDIPGVTAAFAKGIFDERSSHGPYQNYYEFKDRLKLRKLPGGLIDAATGADRVLPQIRPAKRVPMLAEETKLCTQCDRRKFCRAPVPVEVGKWNVMVVGQDPGRVEDRRGRPLLGESGELIMALLEHLKINREHLVISNAFKCRPYAGEEKTPECPWLKKEIDEIKPSLILALGRRAWEAVGGKGSIVKANGSTFKTDAGALVVGAIHPNMVLREPAQLSVFESAVRKFARIYHAALKSAFSETT